MENPRIKIGAAAYDWKTRRPSKWHPDPIEDTDEFCRRILDRALESWGMYLREAEYDDTVQELIFLVWRLEKQFDPDRGQSFSAYATWIVSQRAVDYGPRRVLGRHGTRIRDYMAPTHDPYGEERGYSLGEAIDGISMDSTQDLPDDLERVLTARNSEILRYEAELGFGQNGSSQGRDRKSE